MSNEKLPGVLNPSLEAAFESRSDPHIGRAPNIFACLRFPACQWGRRATQHKNVLLGITMHDKHSQQISRRVTVAIAYPRSMRIRGHIAELGECRRGNKEGVPRPGRLGLRTTASANRDNAQNETWSVAHYAMETLTSRTVRQAYWGLIGELTVVSGRVAWLHVRKSHVHP